MDFQARASQKWLNDTYAAVAGWVPLDEDGITGWGTMYGLRRALQAELGISPLSSGFGEVTTAQFIAQIGAFDSYNLGDLGSWVLDLLQAFGSWERYGGPVDLDQFLRGNLGVDNESANTVGLGCRAVLADADADAFLCGTRPRGTLWSENLREGLGQSSPADRIRRFGQLRLGMSVAATRSVLTQVYDGLDALGVDIGLTRSAILTMTAASRTPTAAETEVIAANFVGCLARLS